MAISEPHLPPPFVLDVAELRGATVVSVVGELDLHTAAELEQMLASLGDRRVVVDLDGVTFLDSTALGVLLKATTKRREPLGLVLARGDVRRVFEITGLVYRFAFFESLDEALTG